MQMDVRWSELRLWDRQGGGQAALRVTEVKVCSFKLDGTPKPPKKQTLQNLHLSKAVPLGG